MKREKSLISFPTRANGTAIKQKLPLNKSKSSLCQHRHHPQPTQRKNKEETANIRDQGRFSHRSQECANQISLNFVQNHDFHKTPPNHCPSNSRSRKLGLYTKGKLETAKGEDTPKNNLQISKEQQSTEGNIHPNIFSAFAT